MIPPNFRSDSSPDSSRANGLEDLRQSRFCAHAGARQGGVARPDRPVELLDDVLELVCNQLDDVSERGNDNVRREAAIRLACHVGRGTNIGSPAQWLDLRYTMSPASAPIRRDCRRNVGESRNIESSSGRYVSGTTTLGGGDSCVGMASAATYSRTDVNDVRASSNPAFVCAIVGRGSIDHAQNVNATIADCRMLFLTGVRRCSCRLSCLIARYARDPRACRGACIHPVTTPRWHRWLIHRQLE